MTSLFKFYEELRVLCVKAVWVYSGSSSFQLSPPVYIERQFQSISVVSGPLAIKQIANRNSFMLCLCDQTCSISTSFVVNKKRRGATVEFSKMMKVSMTKQISEPTREIKHEPKGCQDQIDTSGPTNHVG